MSASSQLAVLQYRLVSDTGAVFVGWNANAKIAAGPSAR